MNATYDVLTLLLRWTALLALAWVVDLLLRRRDARWRIIIWRSVLLLSLALPLGLSVVVPGYEVKLPQQAVAVVERPIRFTPRGAEIAPATSAKVPDTEARLLADAPSGRRGMSIRDILWSAWSVGVLVGFVRLVRLQFRLSALAGSVTIAAPELQLVLRTIYRELGLPRAVPVYLSDMVSSPFACGMFRPRIIMPRSLLVNLPENQLRALIAHELAHIRNHDVAWNLGWRAFSSLLWFHPLVWRIPNAHMLACEEEADRAASTLIGDRAGFSAMLANLALQVIGLSKVETEMTGNGAAQIVRRLRHLERRVSGFWSRWHSAAAAMVATLLLVAAGNLSLAQSKAADAPSGGGATLPAATSALPSGATPEVFRGNSIPGSNLVAAIARLTSNRGSFRSVISTETGLTFRLHRADSSSAIGPMVAREMLGALEEDRTLRELGYSDFKLVGSSNGPAGTLLDFSALRISGANGPQRPAGGHESGMSVMLTLNVDVLSRPLVLVTAGDSRPVDPDALLKNVRAAAEASAVELTEVKKVTEGRVSLDVSVSVIGSLADVLTFMDRLEAQPMLARIHRYTVAATEPPPPVLSQVATPEQQLLDLHEQYSRGLIPAEDYQRDRAKIERRLLPPFGLPVVVQTNSGGLLFRGLAPQEGDRPMLAVARAWRELFGGPVLVAEEALSKTVSLSMDVSAIPANEVRGKLVAALKSQGIRVSKFIALTPPATPTTVIHGWRASKRTR